MRNRTLVATFLLFAVLLSGCALIRRVEPYVPNIMGRSDKVDRNRTTLISFFILMVVGISA